MRDDPDSEQVFNSLARHPFREKPDAPFPAFAATMFRYRIGHSLKDVREARYRGEEIIGGIPCIKLEYRHPRSDQAQLMWIASEGDPHLMQLRSVEEEVTWHFSRWTHGGKVSESLFGEDHQAIRRELPDRMESRPGP